MSNWINSDGKPFNRDVREHIANGTIGGSHIQSAGVSGSNVAQVITPLDTRVTYGGTWSITVAQDINNFLGYQARSSTAASSISTTFFGSSVAVIANAGPNYGRLDVYVDGVLATGQVSTTTTVHANYFPGNLSSTATTINVADTSSFGASGTIVIDGEEITYSGTTATSFTGCTRGANNTSAASHQPGVSVFLAQTYIEDYYPYYQDRLVAWRKSNLPLGTHTIKLVVRSDKYVSSGAIDCDIGGFIIGGILGAQNINTSIGHSPAFSITTNAAGVSTADFAFQPANSSKQVLSILGAFPLSGADWAFPMLVPTSGAYRFATNKASSTFNIVVHTLELGVAF